MITNHHDSVDAHASVEVRHVRLDDHVLVLVTGEIDASNVGMLREALLPPVPDRSRQQVVVDLSGVAFFDVATVNLLVDASCRLERCGGRLTVMGVSTFGQRVLELAGVAGRFVGGAPWAPSEPSEGFDAAL